MIVSIIGLFLLPVATYIMIKHLYIVIHGALIGVNVAPPDAKKLAPQLEEWLSAQPHVAYDATTLAEIFNTSNRAINGSITSLLRRGLVNYDIIDNIKYYYYREG